MSDTNLNEALTAAIKAEHEGHYFYLMAARTTTDTRGREVFERLAADELLHMEYLQRQYQAIQQTGALDASLELAPAPAPATQTAIFSDDLKARLGEAHFEMTALSVGIQLELSAQQFYLEHAGAAREDTAKAFFTELAAWESSHYEVLLAQQDSLREQFWTENRFVPF